MRFLISTSGLSIGMSEHIHWAGVREDGARFPEIPKDDGGVNPARQKDQPKFGLSLSLLDSALLLLFLHP